MHTLNPDTLAAELQSWERFFLNGDGDGDCKAGHGHEELIDAARGTEDAYLNALADRVERLDMAATLADCLLHQLRARVPLR